MLLKYQTSFTSRSSFLLSWFSDRPVLPNNLQNICEYAVMSDVSVGTESGKVLLLIAWPVHHLPIIAIIHNISISVSCKTEITRSMACFPHERFVKAEPFASGLVLLKTYSVSDIKQIKTNLSSMFWFEWVTAVTRNSLRDKKMWAFDLWLFWWNVYFLEIFLSLQVFLKCWIKSVYFSFGLWEKNVTNGK